VFTAGLWISAAAFAGYLAVGSFASSSPLASCRVWAAALIYGHPRTALITLALPRERHDSGSAASRSAWDRTGGGAHHRGALVDACGWRAVFSIARRSRLTVGAASLLLLPRGGRGGAWRLPPREEWLRGRVLGALLLAALANWAQFARVAPGAVLPRGVPVCRRPRGFLFMMTPLSTAAMAPLAGRITDRAGPRLPITLGLTVEAAGLLLISRLDASSSLARGRHGAGAGGPGLGFFQCPISPR
jgi:hypothetical protein